MNVKKNLSLWNFFGKAFLDSKSEYSTARLILAGLIRKPSR